jgi:endonuclease YncB( thermonuclease family)
MQIFTVTGIIDGDTFTVSPLWSWNNQTGDRVRPTGYNTPEAGSHNATAAMQRLRELILGKQVQLTNAVAIDRRRVVCDCFFNGYNLANYFPAYRT